MILTAQMIALLASSTPLMTELISGVELSTSHQSRPKNGGRSMFKQNRRKQAGGK